MGRTILQTSCIRWEFRHKPRDQWRSPKFHLGQCTVIFTTNNKQQTANSIIIIIIVPSIPSNYPSITHLLPIYYPSSTHLLPIYYPSITHLFIITIMCLFLYSKSHLESRSSSRLSEQIAYIIENKYMYIVVRTIRHENTSCSTDPHLAPHVQSNPKIKTQNITDPTRAHE